MMERMAQVIKVMRAVDLLVRPDMGMTVERSGRSIIDDLLKHGVVEKFTEGLETLNLLAELGAVLERPQSIPTTPDEKQFVIAGKRKGSALNDWFESGLNTKKTALEFAEEFNEAVVPVMNAVLYNNGFNVYYDLLRNVPEWYNVLRLLAQLKTVTGLGKLDDFTKKALFFNLANIMIFHSRTVMKVPDSLRTRGAYFSNIIYNIGGVKLNYVDIEHGILRRKFQQRKNADAQCRSLMVDWLDPRMHFALNCGAQSCPIIRPYTSENLDKELDVAASEYMKKFTTLTSTEIILPRLLKWFMPDFTNTITKPQLKTGKIIEYAIRYLSASQQKEAKQTLARGKKLRVKYRLYDWGDNSRPDTEKEVSNMYIYDFSFFLSR